MSKRSLDEMCLEAGMSRRCLEGVLKVSRRGLMSVNCQLGVKMVSGGLVGSNLEISTLIEILQVGHKIA